MTPTDQAPAKPVAPLICLFIFGYCLAALAAVMLSATAEHALTPSSPEPGMDFVQCHVAAMSFRHGLPLYEDNSAHGPAFTDPYYFAPTRFLYPPASVFLFLPATFLPWHVAYWVWVVLQVGILAGISWKTGRWCGLSARTAAAVAVLVCLSYPALFSLERGNFDAAVLLLYWAGIYLWLERKSTWTAAVLIGAAAAVKLFPLMIVGYFLVRRDGRMWARCTISGFAVAVVGAGHLLPEFVRTLVAVTSSQGNAAFGIYNHGMKTFVLRAAVALGQVAENKLVTAMTLGNLTLLALLAGLSLAVFFWRNERTDLIRLEIVPFLLLMAIVPTISYDYKLVLLAYVAPVCIACFAQNWAGADRIPVAIGAISLAHLFAPSWEFASRNPGPWAILWGSKLPAMVLLMVITVIMIHRQRAKSGAAGETASVAAAARV